MADASEPSKGSPRQPEFGEAAAKFEASADAGATRSDAKAERERRRRITAVMVRQLLTAGVLLAALAFGAAVDDREEWPGHVPVGRIALGFESEPPTRAELGDGSARVLQSTNALRLDPPRIQMLLPLASARPYDPLPDDIVEQLELDADEWTTARLRLGDVVDLGERDGVRELRAVLSDERFYLRPADAEEPPPMPAAWLRIWEGTLGAAPAHAAEGPGTHLVQRNVAPPAEPVLVQEKEPLRKRPPVREKEPEPRPPVREREREPEPRPPPRTADLRRGRVTTPAVVTSATMLALLHAEREGIETLRMALLGAVPEGLSTVESLEAIATGVRRLDGRLGSVQRVVVAADPRTTRNAQSAFEAVKERLADQQPPLVLRAAARATVPLPPPGGTRAFLAPAAFPPSERPPVLNPVWATQLRSTPGFGLALAIGWVGALGIALSRRTDRQIELGTLAPIGRLAKSLGRGSRDYLVGILSVPVVALLFLAAGRVWWLGWSDSAAEAGLALTGLALGGALGTVGARGRTLALTAEHVEAIEEKRDHQLRSILYRDTPIEDESQDRLGFRALVEALARFLDNPATAPPVVLGVNGPWGSGKSSLMKLLSKRLEKTGRFHAVWFNAWRYGTQERVLPAFLNAIARELRGKWSLLYWPRLAWTRITHWRTEDFARQLWPILLATLGAAMGAGSVFLDASQDPGQLARTFGGATPGLAWLVKRLVRPFQWPSGASDEPGATGEDFLEEFTREFRLYRRAIGKKKFLFVVDDLDRCDLDGIVEVLKAINLIVTSEQGAGRSFFLLGYDPRYIHRGIERAYAQFAADDPEFARDYLKKMVTLTVSVPRPSSEALADLLRGLDEPDAVEPDAGKGERLPQRAAVGFGAAALAAALLLVLWPAAPPESEAAGAGEASESASISAPSERRAVTPRSQPVPESGTPLWWLWSGAGVAVLGGSALLFPRRRLSAERRYHREPRDSEAFRGAIYGIRQLLPPNPRELVRLVNRMRMQFLVQKQEDLASDTGIEGIRDPFPGKPFNEWEIVSFTLLQTRHPQVYGRANVAERLLETDDPQLEELARDMSLLEEVGPIAHLTEPACLERYVAVNRFLLEEEPFEQAEEVEHGAGSGDAERDESES